MLRTPVRALCDLFDVHPSGYYAWLNQPRSKWAVANERLTGLIKQFWLESGGVYGYRKIFSDLREYGEHCGENRVYRLMHTDGLRAQVGYRRPRHRSGLAHVVVTNRLQRQFSTATPDEAWVTNITYIRTHEGSRRGLRSGSAGLCKEALVYHCLSIHCRLELG